MIRAIQEGRKGQTRRVVKQPRRKDGARLLPELLRDIGVGAACPYGQPGDRLWVRETWALVNADEDGIDDWTDRGPIPRMLPWPGWQVWHRASNERAYDRPDDRGFRWRPSIHMPRWASRITLEVTDVRVQRLQEISEEDAIAEGFPDTPDRIKEYPGRAWHWFRHLWDQINGKGSWMANPYVWAISFRRIGGEAS